MKILTALLLFMPMLVNAGTSGGGVSEVFLQKMSFIPESLPAETPKLLFVEDDGDSLVYLLGGKVISQSVEILEAVDPELLDILEEQFDSGIAASGVTTSL